MESMKRVLHHISDRAAHLEGHPFFSRAQAIDGPEAVEKLKIWAPLFVHLTMTFRDVNQLYYQKANPASDIERAINAHARVDATHWKLLVDDLAVIGVNVGSYGDAMQEIWSERGAPIRNYMYWVLHRAQRCIDSPYMRLTAMESGEASVKMFFSTTRHVALMFQQQTGHTLRYFGDSHIESELENAVDLAPVGEIDVPYQSFKDCCSIVDDHFERFEEFLDYKFKISFL